MRVAIVGGLRTPFVKAGTVFSNISALDLSVHVVKSLVNHLSLKVDDIDELVFSSVLLNPRMPNMAREIVLKSDLASTLPAHFVSNNCISGLVAINAIAEGINSGRIKSGIAGGAESMSLPTLTYKVRGERFFLNLARAKNFTEKLKIISGFKLGDIFPIPPSPKEPSTGLTMGEHCELMVKEFAVTREEQDYLALRSHLNAAKAFENGYFREEITALDNIVADNIIRKETTLEKLAKLKPVFDKTEKGTITAGSASPLTDGASAIYLCSEDKAKADGREILGFVKGVHFTAVHPKDGLLMAPATAIPQLLAKSGKSVAQIDLFEIHEAFAGQVACNLKAWEKGWLKYPDIKPIGKIPEDKINIHGGSIAIGHPFAATGGRLVMSLVNSLKRNNLKSGIISVCAAGGMACGVLVERE